MESEIKIEGKIEKVLEFRSGIGATSGKEWAKQGYLLSVHKGEYISYIAFDVFGKDRISEFALKEGDNVYVWLDIASREFNGRWYTDVKCYKVERVIPISQQLSQPQPAPKQQSAVPNGVPYVEPAKKVEPQKGDDTELPFS